MKFTVSAPSCFPVYCSAKNISEAIAADSVQTARKLTLLCVAKIRAQMPPRCDTSPPLESIAYLAEACTQTVSSPSGRPFPKRNFDERCEWLIDLFERLSLPQGRH